MLRVLHKEGCMQLFCDLINNAQSHNAYYHPSTAKCFLCAPTTGALRRVLLSIGSSLGAHRFTIARCFSTLVSRSGICPLSSPAERKRLHNPCRLGGGGVNR